MGQKFNVSGNFEAHTDVVKDILEDMNLNRQGSVKSGIILTGDPGVGKTSFIEMFAQLMGLGIVLLEVPHASEEHLINIPFIVFNPETHKTMEGADKVNPKDDYHIELADSHLVGQLRSVKKVDDSKYLEYVYKQSSHIIKIFENLGGSENEVPKIIQKVRAHYRVILFLDEYFRKTSVRIRNILRTILNGRIGSTDIPEGAYVLYATNLHDSGIDEIPSNADMAHIEFKTPNKEDWFHYVSTKDKIKDDVLGVFHKALSQDDLNYHSDEVDVVVSPRTWEEILTKISNAYPFKSEAKFDSLATQIESFFKEPKTQEEDSHMADKVYDAMKELLIKSEEEEEK